MFIKKAWGGETFGTLWKAAQMCTQGIAHQPGNVILCGQDLQQFSLELINMRVIGEKLIISAPAGLSSRNGLKRIKRKQFFTYINVLFL